MNTINNKNYNWQNITYQTCFSLVLAYLLVWNLNPINYLIVLDNFQYYVIGLLLVSLWFDTSHVRFSYDWWIYIGLFGGIAFLGTHASQDYLISSIKIKLDIAIVALAFLLFAVFHTRLKELVVPALWVICLVFVIGSVPISLTEIYIEDPAREGFWSTYYKRGGMFDVSLYNHLRHFSYHAFISTCCAYILLMHGTRQAWLRWTAVLCLVISFVALILAYGRASLLVFVIFVMLERYLNKGLKKSLISAAIVLGLIAVTYLILYLTPLKIVTLYLFDSVEIAAEQKLIDGVNSISNGRLTYWKLGIDAALTSPVYGLGTSSTIFTIAHELDMHIAHPHNTIVQFIMDYGFIGAAVLLYVMFRFFRQFFVKFPSQGDGEGLRRSLSAFVLAYLAYGLFDGVFYHPYPMIHFSVLVALLCGLHFPILALNKKS